MHDYIGVHEKRTINFMSDRQKGVLKAISNIFIGHLNRYCARHIFSNFKVKYPSVKIRNLFWAVARATSSHAFNAIMEDIKAVNQETYAWLMDIPSYHWSKHGFDMNAKVDHVTNNMTESFNNQIDKHRCEPILILLEAMRWKMMKDIHKRNQLALTWKGPVPLRVQAAIDKARREFRNLNVIFGGEEEYEVLDENKTKVVVVKLNDFWCQCGSCQISDI